MDRAAVASANKLLKMSGLTDDIVSLAEITPSMIYMIFETAFGSLPEGTIRVPTCQYDDEMNVELILKLLQDEVLQIDLGHINSKKVVHGDVVAVQNLIEILAGYIEYVLEGETLNESQVLSEEGGLSEGEDDGVDLARTQRSPIKSQLSYVIAENDRQKEVLSGINHKYEEMMRRLNDSTDRGERSPVKKELIRDYNGSILSPYSQGVKAAMEASSDISNSLDAEALNSSEFTAGYNARVLNSTDNTTDCSSRDLMIEKLNSLPHLRRYLKKEMSPKPETYTKTSERFFASSAALKSRGLDMSDYSPSSTLQSTPTASTVEVHPATRKQLSYEDSENEDPQANMMQHTCTASSQAPATPSKADLDESIKKRLMMLLERSGNTKHKKRQVRFDLPDSPRLTKYGEEMLRQEGVNPHDFIVPPAREVARAQCENEIEKRMLESELKEKVDLLISERKRLKKLLDEEKGAKPRQGKKKGGKKLGVKSPRVTPKKQDTVNLTDYLLPNLLDEFPFLHVSPQTAQSLWRKQVNQISALTKSDDKYKTKLMNKQAEEQEQRQQLLLNLMKKELDHTTRLHKERAKSEDKRLLKAKLLEQKLTAARVRKYHSDYCERTKARMVKKRTREEQMFKELFEEGLKIQKERLQEMRQTVKQKVSIDAKVHKDEISSLEGYYKNQYELICNKMEEEQKELSELQKERQSGYNSQKMKQRKKMRAEIEQIQEDLVRNDEDLHYHELDVQRALNKIRKT